MRITLIMLFTVVISAWSQKKLRLEDSVYEPQIRTVLCYPPQALEGVNLPSAAARLDAQNLVLEFDDLQEGHTNYYARVIHCNFDWTKSTLMDLDIMKEYNEFPITEYSFSFNTHIPYVHYRFAIPRVKLPGNYVVIVYRDGDKNDLILSNRFLIYSNQLSLIPDDDISGLGNLRLTNQALNFSISYARTEVINPMSSIHVTIRQNQRWDNIKEDVKPSFVRENISQLEYRFFDLDNTFQAGNEFRFVDFRSLNFPGINTQKIDKTRKPYELFVAMDQPRSSQAYTQMPDKNGKYVIDNQDYRQEPWISANYLYVTFNLKSSQLNGDLYVIGAFNGWARTEENKMVYAQDTYSQRILLKQGFYDYQYWLVAPGADGNRIEGSHFQTENQYEILVYYRPFQPNADLLLGYFNVPVNPR